MNTGLIGLRGPWRGVLAPLLGAVLCIVAGCGSTPTRELASYREAFTQARSTSEQILLDFAADAPRRRAVYAAAAADQPVAAPASGWPTTFDPAAAGGKGEDEDSIALRLRAWSVVGAYNNALLALAENRPDAPGAVNGFLEALKKFPKDKVVEAAAAATPFAPAVTLAVTLIENEIRAARFRAAVKAGGPIVHRFVTLLDADLPPLYRNKEVLSTIHYDDLKEQIREEFERLTGVLAAAKNADPTDADQVADRTQLIKRANAGVARIRRMGGWPRIDPAASGSGDDYPSVRGDLASGVARLEDLVAQAESVDAEMQAFHKLLSQYRQVIRRTDSALADLEEAAADPKRSIPPTEDLVRMVIVLRKAAAQYENAR